MINGAEKVLIIAVFAIYPQSLQWVTTCAFQVYWGMLILQRALQC